MPSSSTSNANSYKVVKTLFNQQQDFIIVGLCGKTGSGVSTVAQILKQDFAELNLNSEAPQGLSDYARHEYRILYNYAKKNWSGFYLIKTRALIIARVLLYETDAFVEFLEPLAYPNTKNLNHDEQKDIKSIISDFFNAEMTFSIGRQFRTEKEEPMSLEKFFAIEADPLQTMDLLLNVEGQIGNKQIVEITNEDGTHNKSPEAEIAFTDPKTQIKESIQIKLVQEKNVGPAQTISIRNQDLYKLFRYYQHCRESKKGNLNPVYYWILQEYIFSFLPEQVNVLWDNLNKHDAYKKIETVALQVIGNNLRISDEPYEKPSGGEPYPFKADAYTTIAKDINHSIKILRAYLSKKTELQNGHTHSAAEAGTNNETYKHGKEPVHTHALAVIDSIKNPFESMYLKQRYSNYYLMGVYTDESQRQQRLINSKKFAMPDIKAIDQVEQLRDFKKHYAKWKSDLPDPKPLSDQPDAEPSSKQPSAESSSEQPSAEPLSEQPNAEPLSKQPSAEPLSEQPSTASLSEQPNPELSSKKSNTKPSSEQTNRDNVIVKTLYKRIFSNDLEGVLPFIIQNVSSCLESADIFINNSDDNSAYLHLKHTLIRYISLMMNPGLVLPTDVERCMQTAYVSKVNSGCISRQVGAVVTDNEYQLLSVGWNQQSREQLPCLYRDLCEVSAHYDLEGYSDYENSDTENNSFQETIRDFVQKEYASSQCALKANGKHVPYCFKDIYNQITHTKNQVHTRALHAEETAFLNLSGGSKEFVRGGYLFTTSSPCVLCAKKAKYLGISKIYYVDPYPDISFSHILMAGPKKTRPEFILFTGAIGTAYTRLFTPLLPVKDEHELWLGHKVLELDSK